MPPGYSKGFSAKEIENNQKDHTNFKRKLFSRIKALLKFPSPLLHISHIEQIKKKKLRNIDQVWNQDLIVSVGGGPSRNHPNEINLNIELYSNVDIVGDALQLPLLDKSVDSIVSCAVIEVLKDPQLAVKELYRCLKSPGYIYAEIPFMQRFHPHPGDYRRYTLMGIEKLFDDFEKIDSGIAVGPSSAIACLLESYLKMLIPKSSNFIISFVIRLIVSPIKFLDIFLIKNPAAIKMAAGFYFCGKKSSHTK